MATMMGSLYDALRTAGAAESGAAEEVAGYESRFGKVEIDLRLLKWMVGFNLAIPCALLFKAIV